MSALPVLGIDLGTTNSVVAVAQRGSVRVIPDAMGNLLMPSVVSFHPEGDVIVGHPARERRLLDAHNTIYSVKRLIGRPFSSDEVTKARERFPFVLEEGPTRSVRVKAREHAFTLPEISAFVLREVRRIAESELGMPCSHAVITVPANFNELQRSATKAAGRVAGLNVLRILNEPTAAALAYGYGKGTRERIAIFDFGGGTFDITILELAGDVFEVVATAGDTFLGGDDIDLLVAEQMAEAFLQHHAFDPRSDSQAFERLRAAAEWAKCTLSAETEVQLRVEQLAFTDSGESLDLSFGLSRAALENMTRPLVSKTFKVCEDAMKVAGLRPTQLDNVILVGGSTRMPLVRQMVQEFFEREPLSTIDPDLVVARGAALQGAALAPSSSPGNAKQLAKVSLKRVTRKSMDAAKKRRSAIREEVFAQRPSQPAFAPPKSIIEAEEEDWERLEDLPTRMRKGLSFDEGEEEVSLSSDAMRLDSDDVPLTTLDSAALGAEAFDEDDEDDETQTTAIKKSPPVIAPPPAAPPPLPDASLEGDSSRPGLGKAGGPRQKRQRSKTLGFGSAAGAPSAEQLGRALKRASSSQLPPPLPPVKDANPSEASLPPAAPPPASPSAASPSAASPSGFVSSEPPILASSPVSAAPSPYGVSEGASVAPPLLLDVTPHSLGVETVGGYCESVIERNAAIPVEQSRVFSTAQDGQTSVQFRIVQGESRRLDENQELGVIDLTGLRDAARGEVRIGVTFIIDADGTLGVRAQDLETGQHQVVRVNLVGGVPEEEIARMAERHAELTGEA